MMNINLNDHIGAIHMNALTGRWSIVVASNKINENKERKSGCLL